MLSCACKLQCWNDESVCISGLNVQYLHCKCLCVCMCACVYMCVRVDRMSSDDFTTPVRYDLCGKTSVERLRRVWRGLHPPPQTVSRPINCIDPLLTSSQSEDVTVYVHLRPKHECLWSLSDQRFWRGVVSPPAQNIKPQTWKIIFFKAYEKTCVCMFMYKDVQKFIQYCFRHTIQRLKS